MAKLKTTVKIGNNRLANGKFAPGNIANPKGRPPVPEIEELRKALEKAKKKHGNKHILAHFVERAYESDAVLIALIKKLLADKTSEELKIEGLDGLAEQMRLAALRVKNAGAG
jgi:hypothetical protein